MDGVDEYPSIQPFFAIVDDHDSKVTVDEDNVDYDNFLSTKKDNKVLEEQPDGNNGLDDVHVDIDAKDVDQTNVTTVVVPFERERKVAKRVIGRLIFAAAAYYIWLERNARIFKKIKRSPEEIRDIIKGFVMETRKRKASASLSKPDAASSSKPDAASSSKPDAASSSKSPPVSLFCFGLVKVKTKYLLLKDSNVKEASVEPAIVLDDSCIKEFDFNLSLMGKVNEVPTIPNLPVLIAKEGFLNVKIKYLGGMWLLFDFDSSASKQKFLAHTGVRSWFSILKQADNNFVNNERIIWVSVEGLPVKAWTHNSFRKITSIWGELVEWEDDEHTSFSCKNLCLKTKMDVVINDKRKIIIHGIAYWIRVKEFDAWVPDFEDDDDSLSSGEDAPIFNNDIEDSEVDKVSKTSFIQEFDHVLNFVHDEAPQSKAAEALPNEETSVSEDPFGIYGLLHKNNNNNSGSMESVDPKFPIGFTPSTSDQEKPKEDPVQVSSNCAHPSSSRTRESKKNRGMTSFPNSHSGSFKQRQETKIEDIDVCTIKEVWGNMYFDHVVGPLVGFFGGIIPSSTRLLVISIYAPQELSEKCDLWNYLRSFISRWDGETVLMGGFNEVRSERERFSSVFNQQEGLFDFFPHLSAICLDKNLSDHRPILLRESCLDYGPTSFRFFHSWFSLVGFDAFVENTWNSLMVSDDNALIYILCLDKLFDQGLINDDFLNKKALLLNKLHEINSVNASELSQKAKIRWSIEGDENSKFFHDIINKKRAQLVLVPMGIHLNSSASIGLSLVMTSFRLSKQFLLMVASLEDAIPILLLSFRRFKMPNS
ncbi:RNA-directed DNA polymerase, eukaryota [Tanacetum coccineum]